MESEVAAARAKYEAACAKYLRRLARADFFEIFYGVFVEPKMFRSAKELKRKRRRLRKSVKPNS